MSPIPAPLKPLYEAALKARENSYSPYSRVKVGAAIRTQDGRIYAGCNVENSSFGATVCAERTAIQTAVATEGSIRIADVLVVTDADPAWPPCGMCRQVIAEFARRSDQKTWVHAANLQGDVKSLEFGELFPDAFTPEHLARQA